MSFRLYGRNLPRDPAVRWGVFLRRVIGRRGDPIGSGGVTPLQVAASLRSSR